MKQLCHRVRQRLDLCLRSNLQFGLCLRHVQQQLEYFPNLAIWLKFQLTFDYHVDAVRCLVHQARIKLRLNPSQFVLQVGFVGLHRQIVLQLVLLKINNLNQHLAKTLSAHVPL